MRVSCGCWIVSTTLINVCAAADSKFVKSCLEKDIFLSEVDGLG